MRRLNEAWRGPVLSADEMRELDRATIERGLVGAVLMERAAMACAERLFARFPQGARCVVLAGPGNNGGDGLALARLLDGCGWQVAVVLAADRERLTSDPRTNLDLLEANICVFGVEEADRLLGDCDVAVDSLLGIGATSAPRGRVAIALDALRKHRDDIAFVLAVDVCSGLSTDTGAGAAWCVAASETVTFAAPKWAHVLPGGLDVSGDVYVADIGIPAQGRAQMWSRADVKESLIGRSRAGYKNRFGHVLELCGSETMPGAAILAARGASRCGAGLVTIASDMAVRDVVVSAVPESMFVDAATLRAAIGSGAFTSFVAGCGLGRGADASRWLRVLLEEQQGRTAVLDADALHLLVEDDTLIRSSTGPLILTPHPGELAALLQVATADVSADPLASVRACAEKYSAVVLGKFAGAVIVSPDSAVRSVRGGVPALATAGSGDVLAGMIAALAAALSPLDAAATGAWLHVDAGRRAVPSSAPESMLAGEIADALPGVFAALRAS